MLILSTFISLLSLNANGFDKTDTLYIEINSVDTFGHFAVDTTIIRTDYSDSLYLYIPGSGTQSSVYIYPLPDKKDDLTLPESAKRYGADVPEMYIKIDISNYPLGEYYLNYSSCNVFGEIRLTLK